MDRSRLVSCCGALACAFLWAISSASASDCLRCEEVVVDVESMQYFHVTSSGKILESSPMNERGGADRSDCTFVVSHSDASFEGGSYIAQAGFVEGEIAIAVHDVPAAAYPIKIDLVEMIFVTSQASVQTTTEYSIVVWDGLPDSTPDYLYSSDGTLIPHLVLPPGTNGANVAFQIDPNDPDQIFLFNNGGANKFSVGYRVNQHNSQTGDGCSTPPPPSLNAFPAVDTSGVAAPNGNWLFAITCPLGCTPGYNPFPLLEDPIFGLPCAPSGDWVLRATWTSINCTPTPSEGACCLPDGACVFGSPDDCAAQDGVYQGDDTLCAGVSCPEPVVACCFSPTSCLNLTEANCISAGGTPGPIGSACATFTCFPEGACCLPDGSCIGPVSPEDCTLQGGVFQGNGTDCLGTACPEPIGACCFSTGFCLDLTEADCLSVDAVWGGFGSACADLDGDGVSDECPPLCVGDITGDGIVDAGDLNIVLSNWGCPVPADNCQGADLTLDLAVDAGDLNIVLSDWGCAP